MNSLQLYYQAPDAPATEPLSTDSELTKKERQQRQHRRIFSLITDAEQTYRNYQAPKDARNLAYYRGSFWRDSTGYGENAMTDPTTRNYKAVQNEVFPILDTLKSSLALDLPQVEALDARQRNEGLPGREADETLAGRRIAAVLNWFAEMDDMDDTVQEIVLQALVFEDGGTVKTVWEPALGRPVWRPKLPWEVFFDPAAKRLQDATWAFERFPLHIEDLNSRIEDGSYTKPKKPITGDAYPRALVQEDMGQDREEILRQKGLAEYTLLHEFWDFRKGLVYHVHCPTAQVLMVARMPYGRPYEKLVFHSGIGRIRGISDVEILAPMQLAVNELVSARREIVHRLPRRMLINKLLFKDEDEFTRFTKSRSWEPVLLDIDGQVVDVKQHIYVTPAMDSTFDFNRHLEDQAENMKRISGVADAQRGGIRNIRTAAEVDLVRGGIEGRMQIRQNRLVKCVRRMFSRARDATRWAIQNAQASGLRLGELWNETQADGDPQMLAWMFIHAPMNFRLLPFSPLMEDRNVRRNQLRDLVREVLGNPAASQIVNWPETLRELFELYNLRPSCLLSEQQQEELAQNMAQEQAAAPAPGAPGAPPDMAGLTQPA